MNKAKTIEEVAELIRQAASQSTLNDAVLTLYADAIMDICLAHVRQKEQGHHGEETDVRT